MYEIIWKYELRGYDFPLIDYVDILYGNKFERRQIISKDKDVLNKTIEYLKIISPSDYCFEIREKKYE